MRPRYPSVLSGSSLAALPCLGSGGSVLYFISCRYRALAPDLSS